MKTITIIALSAGFLLQTIAAFLLNQEVKFWKHQTKIAEQWTEDLEEGNVDGASVDGNTGILSCYNIQCVNIPIECPGQIP